MLTDFNRIYPIEIEINNLKQTYNTKAIFTASDLHTSTLLIKIKEQGEPFKLTDCVVTALFSCVDSEIYKQDTTILEPEQGIVGIDLKHDVLQSGTNSLCLKIVSNSTDIMYTPNMTYEVVTTVADGIIAGDRLPIVEEIINDAQRTKERVEQLEKQIITKLETMDTDYQEFQRQVQQQMEQLKQYKTELTTKTDTKIAEMDAKKNEFDETVTNKISTWQLTIDTKVKEAEDSLGKINLAVDEFNNLVDTVTGKLVVGFEYDDATNSLKLTFDNGTVKSVEILKDIPIASKTVLGAVKIGDGLEILQDGTINVALPDTAHTHNNMEELDKITVGKVESWDSKADGTHTHTKSEITDIFQVENSLESNSVSNAISVAQAKRIDDKVNNLKSEYGTAIVEIPDLKNKAHTHDNKTELDKIVAGKVESWDSKADGTHTHTKSEITDIFQVENSLESNSIVNAVSVAQAKRIDDKVNTKETVEGSQAKANKSLQDAKQYTDNAIQTLVGTAPPVLDTIYEIASAIQQNEGVVEGLTGEIAKKSNVGHTHTKSEITDMPSVIDGLDSTSVTDVLSANQGKLLNEKIIAQQDALSKAHTHDNKTELDKIVAGKVESWDSKADGTHTHTATQIIEDTTHRFVTDDEKNKWNNSTEISDTTTTTTSTWSSQKISTELGKATPSDYAQVKADVEKLKSDVGTARTNLINSVNNTINNL